jgi:hypothetical protein
MARPGTYVWPEPARVSRCQIARMGGSRRRDGMGYLIGAADAGGPGRLALLVTSSARRHGRRARRLDPLEVARVDGVGLGLAASDSFQLVSVNAVVCAQAQGDASVTTFVSCSRARPVPLIWW